MNRKKHSLSKLIIMLLTLAIVLTMACVPALAETSVTGTDTITFDKYLVMKVNSNVPNANFSYAIAPGTAVAAVTTGESKKPAVMAGPDGAKLVYDGGTPATSVTVAFAPTDATSETVLTGDTVTLTTGQKYAVKTVTVDLTDVTFTEPGIYRYNITETGTNPGITNDTIATRYLDIYVESNGDALSIGGSVMHNTTEILGAAGGTYDASHGGKDGGFTNTYATYDLTVSKTVTGNQGYRQKYFTFTVNITGAVAGTVYTVDLNDASISSNPTSITATDGTATATFLLKHDESIIIKGLTATTNYAVSEAAEDYTPSYILDTNAKVDSNAITATAMGTNDHTLAFTNYRNGVVPTGILLDVAPYLLIVVLVIVALVLFSVKKRKSTRR